MDRTLEPLSRDSEETQLWLDYELASFAENRLGHFLNPRSLSDSERAKWTGLATDEGRLYVAHTDYWNAYWVIAEGERAGTAMLSTSTLGQASPSLASLYILRDHRGRGYARHLLKRIYEEILRAGLDGLRLDTNWCWESAVKFYAALGMWVRGWKREIVFVWRRDLVPWTIEIAGDEARFDLDLESGRSTAITARRVGDRLAWSDTGVLEPDTEMAFLAPGTFALALALRGWPLITDDDEWQQQRDRGWSDFGGPEGLAYKIRLWEAWAHSKSWRVTTPRIPGLDYPTWVQLEDEWKRRQALRDARAHEDS